MSKRALRIAHVTGVIATKYGAQQRFMVALAKECTKRGHKFFCFWDEMPKDLQFIKDLKAEEGEIVIIPVRGRSISFLTKITFWLRRNRIDVIHSHFNPASLLSLIAARLVRVPVPVVSFRSGFSRESIKNYSFRSKLVTSMRYKLAKRVFTVSDAVGEQYRELGFDGPKIMTRYTGIMHIAPTRNRVEMWEEFELSDDEPVIACVAFHSPMKGVDVLLRAMAILTQEFPKVRLLEVGGSLIPEETEQLHRLAEDIGIAERVIWTGHRNDVRNILECADLYCQPSRQEGLPLAVLEAMDAGLAVVASRVGGIPEAVVDGHTGILVEPESPESLAEGLARLLRDKSGRKKMGQRAQPIVREKFNLENQTRLLVDMYEDMVDKIHS